MFTKTFIRLFSNPTKKSIQLKNDQIKAKTIRLIGVDGKNIGLVSFSKALSDTNLKTHELVQVSYAKDENVPICKIISKPELSNPSSKEGSKEASHPNQIKKDKPKKNKTVLKELEISTVISQHDFDIKMKKAKEFFEKGHNISFHVNKRTETKTVSLMMMKIINALEGMGKIAGEALKVKSSIKFLMIPIKKFKPKTEVKEESPTQLESNDNLKASTKSN